MPSHPTTYPTEPTASKGELPDLFAWPNGLRVSSREEWLARSRSWRDLILDTEYGGMPPNPEAFEIETLCHSRVRRWTGSPNLWTFRVHCHASGSRLSFCVRLLFPDTTAQLPVIIHGDGCWWYLTEDVAQQALAAGCALVEFNRTEFAEDLGYPGGEQRPWRSGGLYDLYPDRTFGALSAWAWGYHRCVDLVTTLPFIDPTRIAVTGHSRGGKTTLLAGATDERITLINDNASGGKGSAAFRYIGHGGNPTSISTFPSWSGPALQAFLGREAELPFDQHCLLATITPRPLLITYALDDRLANPEGMVQCAWAAGEAYRFLDTPENLAFHFRPGGHAHTPEDWAVLLDFIAWKWMGKEPRAAYNRHPYAHLRPAFSWKAPAPK